MKRKKRLRLLLMIKKIKKATDILLRFAGLKQYTRRWACTCQGMFDDSPFHCICYLNDDGRTVFGTDESLERYRRRINCVHYKARLAFVSFYIEQRNIEKVADELNIKIRGRRKDVFESTSGDGKN